MIKTGEWMMNLARFMFNMKRAKFIMEIKMFWVPTHKAEMTKLKGRTDFYCKNRCA
jgi:hypothetical protein